MYYYLYYVEDDTIVKEKWWLDFEHILATVDVCKEYRRSTICVKRSTLKLFVLMDILLIVFKNSFHDSEIVKLIKLSNNFECSRIETFKVTTCTIFRGVPFVVHFQDCTFCWFFEAWQWFSLLLRCNCCLNYCQFEWQVGLDCLDLVAW